MADEGWGLVGDPQGQPGRDVVDAPSKDGLEELREFSPTYVLQLGDLSPQQKLGVLRHKLPHAMALLIDGHATMITIGTS
jgi:hypothetical protein